MNPRDRLPEAGSKPLQAAAIKNCGGEHWSQSARTTGAGKNQGDERK